MNQDQDRTLDFYQHQARAYPSVRARPIQRYTQSLEQRVILPYLIPGARVLDLGCGEGRLARWMAGVVSGVGGRVHGVDFSPQMISIAQASDATGLATYSVGDAMALDVTDHEYDVVVSSTAPNNFPDLPRALKEVTRVLRPGGVFIGIIINRDEAARFARHVYYAPYYAYSVIRRVLRGDAYHRRLYSRDELVGMLADARLDLVSIDGMRSVADWIPEFPLNFWRPLFPVMDALIGVTSNLDSRLSSHPAWGRRARFHVLVARSRN